MGTFGANSLIDIQPLVDQPIHSYCMLLYHDLFCANVRHSRHPLSRASVPAMITWASAQVFETWHGDQRISLTQTMENMELP